jgi:hypothetical protein
VGLRRSRFRASARILVPLDGSAFAEAALPVALEIAGATGNWCWVVYAAAAWGVTQAGSDVFVLAGPSKLSRWRWSARSALKISVAANRAAHESLSLVASAVLALGVSASERRSTFSPHGLFCNAITPSTMLESYSQQV